MRNQLNAGPTDLHLEIYRISGCNGYKYLFCNGLRPLKRIWGSLLSIRGTARESRRRLAEDPKNQPFQQLQLKETGNGVRNGVRERFPILDAWPDSMRADGERFAETALLLGMTRQEASPLGAGAWPFLPPGWTRASRRGGD